jgi:hypothetical protein
MTSGGGEPLDRALQAIDPANVSDVVGLNDVATVAFGNESINSDIREVLAQAWLRVLALTPCLDRLHSAGLFEAGLKGLNDSSWLVRAHAAESFTYLGNETHVPLLIEKALDPMEHHTVRADAIDAAVANSPNPNTTVLVLLEALRDDRSHFVSFMVRLHGLLRDIDEGPSTSDVDSLAQDEEGLWPPRESAARILRTVAWLFPSQASPHTRQRTEDLVQRVIDVGVPPLYVELVEPALTALAR